MHTVSHRTYYCLQCSSRVNIQAPAFYSTIMSLLTVSQLELHSLQLPTAMSDSQSINTSSLQVTISSKNDQIFFMIWLTFHYKSYSTLSGLRLKWAESILLLGIIEDMCLHGASICTVELSRPVALVSYVLFVIKFLAIHHNMRPASWEKTCWQKPTLQS